MSLVLLMETLVAILLVATIGYCMLLDRRLKQLRADEQSMRRIVGELAMATDNAERAIGGLRQTVTTCDETLAQRLETAERFAVDLCASVKAGEEIIDRVRRIVATARKHEGSLATDAGHAPTQPEMAVPHSVTHAPILVPQPTQPASTPGIRLQAAAMAAEMLAARAGARARATS